MNPSFIAYVVNIAFEVYLFIVLARVLLSWIRMNPYGKIYQFVFSLTEPLLAPIRRFMPKGMMLDFSPMILMFLLILLRKVVLMLIFNIL
ncbi:MAG TPA: YggT family protein [Clostridiales bacterium]|nr:YggT family protein [Clostridiales bacterium]